MNAFTLAQARVVATYGRRHLGNLQHGVHFVKLASESPATFAVIVDLLERTLEGMSATAKAELVAAFKDADGNPCNATVEKVEAALASGNVPRTFVFENRRLVKVFVFEEMQKRDLIGHFRTEMEKAAKVADSASEAAGEKKTGTDD